MADSEDVKPDVLGDTINLKVMTQDGNEIFFKCYATTPLDKLMKVFCQRQGVSSNTVRFLLDGQRINTTQTPQEVRRQEHAARAAATPHPLRRHAASHLLAPARQPFRAWARAACPGLQACLHGWWGYPRRATPEPDPPRPAPPNHAHPHPRPRCRSWTWRTAT